VPVVRYALRRRAAPQTARPTARISSERATSSTARASIIAPTISARVAIRSHHCQTSTNGKALSPLARQWNAWICRKGRVEPLYGAEFVKHYFNARVLPTSNEPRGARLGVRRCRATTLYSVGSNRDPHHEAVIRFSGEAPRRR
jgi:hypothetical protein